jgi:hypothetical protein
MLKKAADVVSRSQEFFDPWLACDHPATLGLVDHALECAEAGRLKRRGREKDRQTLRGLAIAVVSNAAHALALGLEPPGVAIILAKPRGPASRYDGLSLRLVEGVRKAIEPSFITISPSRTNSVASVLLPGDALRECVGGLNDFGLASFKRTGGETIIVRRVERDYAADVREAINVEYRDTADTLRMRAELDWINAAIESARLEFIGPQAPDVYQRRLRRIFTTNSETPRFDLNGRLHGGWWENVRRDRRNIIRIEGETVADLDFSAMFLRLAYTRIGLKPPSGELYAGILGGAGEGLYRDGVKQIVNAMLARSSPLTRLPKGCKALLPKGCTARSIREAALERHSAIREQFERGAALRLMRTDSDILVAVLLRVIDRHGVVAPPMHDGLMVRESCAATAEAVMREVGAEVTGFELDVKRKPLKTA